MAREEVQIDIKKLINYDCVGLPTIKGSSNETHIYICFLVALLTNSGRSVGLMLGQMLNSSVKFHPSDLRY